MPKVLFACAIAAAYASQLSSGEVITATERNLRVNADSSFSSNGDAAAGLEEKTWHFIVAYPCKWGLW
ncbi:uncharacterized protein PITG_06696 [Phytophthora infestans T30-4]|uniref:Secreted RxLR effector peptide protein n=2 Tax=Phytophthora infestans TaxID=4787 RepID=D0N5H0_PHYIT|nr:uncharacterized protein PITG_06696 [Phytophthora infestans T30-4]EEY70128.1 hypothetical protein PITG_06696 [Phytophthora infestans T30-4]KAF4038471.1 hypothetical protein GN244_ATG09442 [Phytophthora infestans]KAI9983284.1 hypothetical protein PInf_007239 [Phytophthora infestans]|eukprot:XP_002998775.1 hypothetical protein PITG_06696 [Phytophthora infestans T30-4]